MATKVITTLIDDLDGSDADETLSFRIDGTDYEIDLSGANAAGLRDALAPYIAAGRKIASTGKLSPRQNRQGRPQPSSPSDIREWAENNGHKTNGRGRIPARILEAFEKATA